MIGQEITNVTLTANTGLAITYQDRQQVADIVNYGPGSVYVSWQKDAAIGDSECLRLDEGQTYQIKTKYHWQILHLISAGTPAVQVVAR